MKKLLYLGAVLLVLLIAGCATSTSDTVEELGGEKDLTDMSPVISETPSDPIAFEDAEIADSFFAMDGDMIMSEGSMRSSSLGATSSMSRPSDMIIEPLPEYVQPAPGTLTAGEWSDLDNWDFWLNLGQRQEFSGMASYWEYDRVLGERYRVSITTPEGNPVIGEPVLLMYKDKTLWRAVTDNHGVAELWAPRIMYRDAYDSRTLNFWIRGESFVDVVSYRAGENRVVLPNSAVTEGAVDIAWVVDATGSMSDELEFLKTELQDVIRRVQIDNPDASIRMGTVFYRDEGDAYITKSSPMSSNIGTTISFIGQQYASGGGDFPEAVHTALFEALNGLEWSQESSSKLMFLLLDAPPHYNDQVIADIHNMVSLAASMGVRIIPIVASGIDKNTEFLMRYMAIATDGTYTFITNHSGVGNNHLEPTVGSYSIEFLNDLLVRLINESLE